MIDFLRAHDAPNWAFILIVSLAYLTAFIGEKRAKLSDELRRASAEERQRP